VAGPHLNVAPVVALLLRRAVHFDLEQAKGGSM
jgi:hypothetical protein